MSQSFLFSPVVGYASTYSPDAACDLDLLRHWCQRVPIVTEMLSEDMHPCEPHRPLWTELLKEIERGNVTTLIVPSLFHIAGDDVISLSKVLTLLKMHRVTLHSLTEFVDSRRDSNTEVILKMLESSPRFKSKGIA